MKKVPISLIIDDPAPAVSVFYSHSENGHLRDGRPMPETFPNSFLDKFCDIVERYGLMGKFSIVPMPGNRGDIINGLDCADDAEIKEWLDTVKARLLPNFTIGPEMLTHNKAVDLSTGNALPLQEHQWASTQDRTTLTPYIAKALEIVNQAGFDSFGVTSPWNFGIEVEEEYGIAISRAVYQVTGKKNAWYFLRGLRNTPNAKPWVQLEEEGRTLVSIPATTNDVIWASINTTDTSDEFVKQQADILITEDGTKGQIIQVLETNGYPILITHWQSLFSNGLQTGLRILDEIGKRVTRHLSDRVEWMNFEQIMNMVVADKANYPKPVFEDQDI